MAAGGLQPFRLERFFARFEFGEGTGLLCCSDANPLSMRELLAHADDDARARWESLGLGYTEYTGLPELRAAVAGRYAACVTPEHVLCCVPQEGVLLLHALLTPGCHVVTTAPGYQSLYSIAQTMGCEVSHWLPTRDAAGRLHFDVAELRKLLRPTTAAIVMNFPHNPTGCVLSATQLDEVVAEARARGCILFADEIYRNLELTDEARVPSAAELYERAVALGGLSKSHGCPGLRCGWLITRDASLYARLAEAKDFTTICGSAPSEVLSLMAVRASDAILARNHAIIRRNLALLDAFFARHAADWEWTRPQAGTVAFPRLLTGESADAFSERVRLGCNVLVLPSSVYDAVASGEQRMRIGFGRNNLPDVLARFETFLYGAPPA